MPYEYGSFFEVKINIQNCQYDEEANKINSYIGRREVGGADHVVKVSNSQH